MSRKNASPRALEGKEFVTSSPGAQLRVMLRSAGTSYFADFSCEPEKFYKGGSQEKTHLLRPVFFLLPSPLDRARSVLNFRAMDSGAGHNDPAVWVFSISGFHRF